MVSKKINRAISKIEPGKVFRLKDLSLTRNEQQAAARALSRLAQTGKIVRVRPGSYYKAKETPFGILGPSIEELFKDLLYKNGEVTGYLTGYYAFNLLGLTTQQGSIIEIGTNYPKRARKRGLYRVRYVLQRNEINSSTIPLLRVLDCIKWIKKIPDTSVENSYKIIAKIVQGLSEKETKNMVELAMLYPPVTRSLLGSMVNGNLSDELFKTLNPLTKYEVGLTAIVLDDKWNIV